MSDQVDVVQERQRRDVAFMNLREVLDTKKRGDRLTAREIIDSTGFQEWQSFRSRIRKHLRKRGLFVQAVMNDGYRILMAAEHVDFSEKKRRSAFRSDALGLLAANTAPIAELDDRQIRKLEFVRARQQHRVSLALEHDQETRKELGTTRRERIPLLGKKDSPE